MIPASVVITTKNRKDDLRVCLRSVLQQLPVPEVVVVDDGSTDGTSAMVLQEFPSAVLVRHDDSAGYIRRRNEGARIAQGRIIVSLDDDAVFSSPGIVAATVAAFDDDRVAAVAIPYIDVNRNPSINQLAPDSSDAYVVERYIGTAHAVRRDVFLALGGYREHLFHQGEESDLCIRLLDQGRVVRLGHGDPIHHFESPRRDFRRMDVFGPRNAVLFAWQNVPLPALLVRMPMTIAGVIAHTLQPLRLFTRIRGVIDGLVSCLSVDRRPVRQTTYALWRRLQRASPPLTLRAIASELSPR